MTGESRITEADVADLVRRMDKAADAYIRGYLQGYVAQFDHGDDYTLMPPYGGGTRHGFEYTEDAAARTKDFFASGEARLDVQQTYVSGDLAVLVAVERQHGAIEGRIVGVMQVNAETEKRALELISRRTDDRLNALKPLAEDIASRIEALERRNGAIEDRIDANYP